MGWERRIVLRFVAGLISAIAVAFFALWYFIPAPPSTITIAVGTEGGSFEHLALRYRERLAAHHVRLKLRFTKSSADSIKLLRDPKSGLDAAFSLGGVANGDESPEIVSLGRIAYSPIWIFYRASETINHLSQLRGKRISVGPTSGPIVAAVLSRYGINPENTAFVTLSIQRAAENLRAAELDALFISLEVNNPNIQSLLHDDNIRVLNVAQAEALTQLFPSLNKLVMSQGVIDLERNLPSNDTNLIALTSVVVTRANLHPEMVYLLAQTMKEEHSRGGIFQRPGEFPTQTDPEFPVADEALDYYRNGHPFLQRYLAFWMINHAKRLIAISLTVFAVIIPLLTYAPKIYDWFLRVYLNKLYRRLRTVEAELQNEIGATEIEALEGDLERIRRAACILPMRHSDLFVDLIMHIRQTRSELKSRLIGSRA